jgi:Predicted pPIWI-associating nuclease
MAIDAEHGKIADDFWIRLEALEGLILKSKARDLTSTDAREAVRTFVKLYFSDVRPIWQQYGLDEDSFHITDAYCQELLQLANGKNRRLSYLRKVRAVKQRRPVVEMGLAQAGSSKIASPDTQLLSKIENKILQNLNLLIPTAALSYQQVLLDLRSERVSYRGTAVDLREALREVLDHLAPDKDVMEQPNFKLEQNVSKPTMKQKALFVLKARGLPGNAMNAAKDSVSVTDSLGAQMARSVYEKGSIATHIASSKDEVARVKQYTDAVLIELLQISLS